MPLFRLFLSISHSNYNFNNTNWKKSLDGVLGIRTQDCRMLGTDETTELRRHAKVAWFFFKNESKLKKSWLFNEPAPPVTINCKKIVENCGCVVSEHFFCQRKKKEICRNLTSEAFNLLASIKMKRIFRKERERGDKCFLSFALIASFHVVKRFLI